MPAVSNRSLWAIGIPRSGPDRSAFRVEPRAVGRDRDERADLRIDSADPREIGLHKIEQETACRRAILADAAATDSAVKSSLWLTIGRAPIGSGPASNGREQLSARHERILDGRQRQELRALR